MMISTSCKWTGTSFWVTFKHLQKPNKHTNIISLAHNFPLPWVFCRRTKHFTTTLKQILPPWSSLQHILSLSTSAWNQVIPLYQGAALPCDPSPTFRTLVLCWWDMQLDGASLWLLGLGRHRGSVVLVGGRGQLRNKRIWWLEAVQWLYPAVDGPAWTGAGPDGPRGSFPPHPFCDSLMVP